MSKYKYEGPTGNCHPTRTLRKWLIAFEDGEEIYSKKGIIIQLGKLSIQSGQNVHVYEETITRRIMNSVLLIEEDKFRIDITERLRNEIRLENLEKSVK